MNDQEEYAYYGARKAYRRYTECVLAEKVQFCEVVHMFTSEWDHDTMFVAPHGAKNR
jgi:hypothetical protein